MSGRQSTWQRFRSLPIATQTACALMAIVILALVAGVLLIAQHDGDSHRQANSAAIATTTTTSTSASGRLVPLAIAPVTHVGSYARATEFGGFRDVDGCRNVRAVLLIRSSSSPVT